MTKKKIRKKETKVDTTKKKTQAHCKVSYQLLKKHKSADCTKKCKSFEYYHYSAT